ncbi:MAG: ExbD/TolR family protein [Gammaproteobacteria bacterium]
MGRRKKHPIKITFVPLVDCFIILLIFFMLQSSFVVPHGIELASSKKEDNDKQVGTTTAESTLVFIELHKDGTVWLDGEQVRLAELGAKLPRIRGDAKPVIVASDPGVKLQRAVDVIDVANAHGYTKISLREAQQFK